MPRRLTYAFLAAALLVLLVDSPGALGGHLHPGIGRFAERRRHRHALQDHALRRDRDLPDRRGHADLVAGALPRTAAAAPRPPRSAATPRSSSAGRSAAALILVVLTVVTFIYLPDIKTRRSPARTASRRPRRRFASIDQPASPGRPALPAASRSTASSTCGASTTRATQKLFSYHTMVVPVDTTVVLEITASDVIHSWWIPKLGGKADAVPGHVNKTWFKIPRGSGGHALHGPVRRAVRRGPRRHARRGQGRHAGAVPVLGRASGQRHRGSPARLLAEQRKSPRG